MKRIFSIWLVAFICTINATAQAPKWAHDTPVPTNDTYEFIVVESTGRTLSEARQHAKSNLASDEQLKKGVLARENSSEHTVIRQHDKDGDLYETTEEVITIDVKFDGREFPLKARKIDEYYTHKDGEYRMSTLYQVALTDRPIFDRTLVTSSYGVTPVIMSIIPGLGQWYKGSKGKAAGFFLSELALVAGVVWTDNERATNVKLGKQHPEHLSEYSNRADSWQTARNVCIGAAAGIWLWNMIDAGCAKGARRVILPSSDGGGFSLNPYITPVGTGMSIAYKF